jgi:hypothetical protein
MHYVPQLSLFYAKIAYIFYIMYADSPPFFSNFESPTESPTEPASVFLRLFYQTYGSGYLWLVLHRKSRLHETAKYIQKALKMVFMAYLKRIFVFAARNAYICPQ